MNNNLKSFTMADRRSSRFHISNIERIAFTMAEILLSLTIIGVVAAITLPSLTGNINERTWNTQRKALYARMTQAIALMPYVSGFGIGQTNSQTTENAARAFVYEGLSRVLKINNICEYNNFDKCGIKSTYKAMDGTTKSMPRTNYELHNYLAASQLASGVMQNSSSASYYDSYSLRNMKAAAFETVNGESMVVYYQPYCINSKVSSARWQYLYVPPYMCANFIFDLNGKKGPNTVGKDIGYMTLFYATNSSLVMPNPLPNDAKAAGQTYDNTLGNNAPVLSSCKTESNEYRLPNKEELASIMINSDFSGIERMKNSTQSKYYVASRMPENRPWVAVMAHDAWSTLGYGTSYYVRCVKR